jgi:hypothetical protein
MTEVGLYFPPPSMRGVVAFFLTASVPDAVAFSSFVIARPIGRGNPEGWLTKAGLLRCARNDGSGGSSCDDGEQGRLGMTETRVVLG